jgi:putative membrane protein
MTAPTKTETTISRAALFGLALLLSLTYTLGVRAARAAEDGSPDLRFVTGAAQANLAEVELGRLAAAKGTHPDVREYGQKSVDDHTRFGDRLQAIARPKGFGIPTAMSAAAEDLFARLTTSEGAEFDRLYMGSMAMDYGKVVDLFQKEAETGKDADLRAFAAETLPALVERLGNAQAVADRVGAPGEKKN